MSIHLLQGQRNPSTSNAAPIQARRPASDKNFGSLRGTSNVLQRLATEHEPEEVPQIVHEVIRSPGLPFDAETRALMEQRFQHDFSRVRVHTDSRASESARHVRARAYAVGTHLVFNQHQFQPWTDLGRSLIAHELTHVLQQRAEGETPVGELVIDRNSEREREAEQASALIRGNQRPPPAVSRYAAVSLSRQVEAEVVQGGAMDDCEYRGNVGRLRVDCGCRGVLRLWLIHELSAPASAATCGRWIDADGFVLHGNTYKIDGSTCVTIRCFDGIPKISTTVAAFAAFMGKGDAHIVSAGEFGGPPKEPATGAIPPLVE